MTAGMVAFLLFLAVVGGLVVGLGGVLLSYESLSEGGEPSDHPDRYLRSKKYWLPRVQCFACGLMALGSLVLILWVASA